MTDFVVSTSLYEAIRRSSYEHVLGRGLDPASVELNTDSHELTRTNHRESVRSVFIRVPT